VDESFSAILFVLFQQFDAFQRIKITDALQGFCQKIKWSYYSKVKLNTAMVSYEILTHRRNPGIS
jgi:hypothetical protein